MFRQTLRPAFRSIPRQSRQYSSSSTSAFSARTAALIAVSGGVAVLAYAQAPSQRLHADTRDKLPSILREKDVSKSVLDQPSLKEPIHKRGASKEDAAPASDPAPDSLVDTAEKASDPQQGAFNEETGEINWDCPCLGGMADGPCGEDFKAAFSCFVYSEAEPKGMDCVEKFKDMQDCFRKHPDIYGEEIEDDEDAPADAPSVPDVPAEDPRPKSQLERGGGPKPITK